MPRSLTGSHHRGVQLSLTDSMAYFDPSQKRVRDPPSLPDTNGIDYVRAASWAVGSCANVLADEKGFLEATDKLKKMKSGEEKREYAKEIMSAFSPYVNLSDTAMKQIKAAVESEGNVDSEGFAPAIKEIQRLLENDQFPRFRRSQMYLSYLEELLPRSYAEKWTTSFESLLGNHVGRHHFRLFLQSIRAEEYLRLWEAVVEFRSTKNRSPAMHTLAQSIYKSYLAEGCAHEVYLPFGVRQVIERKLTDKEIDITIFDDATKNVEQVLRNDPYVRFLQSPMYIKLLSNLRR